MMRNAIIALLFFAGVLISQNTRLAPNQLAFPSVSDPVLILQTPQGARYAVLPTDQWAVDGDGMIVTLRPKATGSGGTGTGKVSEIDWEGDGKPYFAYVDVNGNFTRVGVGNRLYIAKHGDGRYYLSAALQTAASEIKKGEATYISRGMWRLPENATWVMVYRNGQLLSEGRDYLHGGGDTIGLQGIEDDPHDVVVVVYRPGEMARIYDEPGVEVADRCILGCLWQGGAPEPASLIMPSQPVP